MAYPQDLEQEPAPRPESSSEPKPDRDQPAYRLARLLVETAKAEWKRKSKPFRSHWQYILGKNHWQLPETAQAQALDEWTCKSIRNWLFATVDHKSSVIQDSDPTLHVEPLDDESTYVERLYVKSALEHEAKRLRSDEIHEDVYLWGSACGIGASLVSTSVDALTGRRVLRSIPLDMNDVYPDPDADRREDAQFMVWEPDLSMATWYAMFGEKARAIKPTGQDLGVVPEIQYRADDTQDNLIYGTTGEYAVDKQGVKRLSARGCFVWQKDPASLKREFERRILDGPEPGYQCLSCGLYVEEDAAGQGSEPCPLCQGDLVRGTIPQGTEVQKTRISKLYPHGRLTIYSGETLLFDGPNPDEIEEVFPIAFYHHYRIPGSFPGYGDVALLKSPQQVADTNGGMLVDATRLASLGILEWPRGAPEYASLGNRAGSNIGVKDHLIGKARWLTPQGINVQMWQTVDSMNQNDFRIVAGVANLSGIASSPPISATEAEIAAANASVRMKGHMARFNRYRSDWYSLVLQLARQYYSEPMRVPVALPDSSIESRVIEWSKLPRGVRVRVSADLKAAQTDKLLGQNITMLTQSGALPPYADMLLASVGAPPAVIREWTERANLDRELQRQTQMSQSGPPMGPPPASVAGLPAGRPSGIGPEMPRGGM